MELFNNNVVLKDLHELLQDSYTFITFNEESCTEERAIYTAHVEVDDCFDDEISIKIISYQSGTFHVFMIFDKIEATLENLMLINKYNERSAFLRAYISSKEDGTYLEVHGTNIDSPDTESLCNTICFFINELFDDNTLPYLQEITKYTYQE